MTLIPLDRKQLILEDAKERILENHTLEQIAQSHKITKRTLNTWLMSLGDEYQELRQLCIDNMLAEALDEIDNSESKLVVIKLLVNICITDNRERSLRLELVTECPLLAQSRCSLMTTFDTKRLFY